MKLFQFLKLSILGLVIFLIFSCNQPNTDSQNISKAIIYSVFETDSIVDDVMYSVRRFPINSQERRNALDSAIARYPSIANFHQQRAMSLYKEDKDELGQPFLVKAAELNPQKYLDYKGFME